MTSKDNRARLRQVPFRFYSLKKELFKEKNNFTDKTVVGEFIIGDCLRSTIYLIQYLLYVKHIFIWYSELNMIYSNF